MGKLDEAEDNLNKAIAVCNSAGAQYAFDCCIQGEPGAGV
jgi:hypothetical protein